MKLYSEDLRRRIVRAVRVQGVSKIAAARLFDVSLSSVKRYMRIANWGASLDLRKGGGRPPKVDQSTEKLLEEDVHQPPGGHRLWEATIFAEKVTGKSLRDSTVKRVLKRMGFSQKNGLLWGRQNETNGEEPSGGSWSRKDRIRSGLSL